ncbi:hypothetical protein B0H10DRAFT_2056089 [Mycena sp. CBHHK59/15]|nr:hypothetical protein B0H10DRAFT_2056089 [Mycena sp. CBHHK59/15]
MPAGSGEYIYHVMRHTEDHHNGEHTEIRGTYATLKEANAAARVDLTKDHEVEEEDGMVSVTAECPEGEIMTVYVEKKAAPKLVATLRASKQGKTTAKNPPATVSPLKEVWIIVQTDYAHHTDEEGRSDVASSQAYEAVRDANFAARDALLDACGVEDEEELDGSGIEVEEENRNSTTKAYVGRATVYRDDVHEIKVEVTNLTVRRASGGTKRSSSSVEQRSAKKRKIEPEEVIDISSD